MSATERLRALLDERGVEHEGGERSLRWRDRYGVMIQAFPLANGELGMGVWSCTPEQAIAATLGVTDAKPTQVESSETCHDEGDLVRVVRCRDCKFYTPESMTREERGFGVYENMWEPGGCFNPERCSATWDSIAGQMVPVGINTEPDGFCAWGERRESE